MMSKFVAAFRAKPMAEKPGEPSPMPPALDRSDVASLSAREMEILKLIARGDSNKLIARALDIAETTVKVHVQHIFRKLQLSSRVQVAVYAAAHRLI
jgi:two-component system nitrate/nitrite response regulator NarL